MIKDLFLIAFSNLGKRKLRSWLTVLGIFVGIAAVVALFSLSQGLENAIVGEFQNIGPDKALVTPGGAAFGPDSSLVSAVQFTEEDVDIVAKVRGVKRVSGVVSNTGDVEFGRQTRQASVFAVPNKAEDVKFFESEAPFEIEFGRYLRSTDGKKVVVGWEVANEYFDKEIHVGNKLIIEGEIFEVVGVLLKKGRTGGDNRIIMPKSVAREIFNEPVEVNVIQVVVHDPDEMKLVSERIKRALRKFRDVKEGEEDFSIQTPDQLIQTINSVLGVVQVILVGIAMISLFVGAVGIMNTMYTAVVERTKEIGIMKSIGAANNTVLALFLMESGLIGAVGGGIGVLLGLSISKSVEFIALAQGFESLKAYLGMDLILGAIIFSFVLGSLSGTLPARQASKLQPVEALRKRL